LEDGKTGFLCEVQNPESIANTVERIMKLSHEEKKEIHKNAMKVIEGKYNWEYIVSRMKYFFNTLCES